MEPKSINDLNEMLEEGGELTDGQIKGDIEAFSSALTANINKPQKYFMKNCINDEGRTEWEKENEKSANRQGAYCRVENIMHVLANTDLITLCKIRKKYGEQFYEFIYFLYTISEIEEQYDSKQEHFLEIRDIFKIKAEFAKRLYKISNEDSERNKALYNIILLLACDSMSPYDFEDVDPELVYNLEDSLMKIINELIEKLDTEDEKEDIFIEKFVNNRTFDWLILDNLKEVLKEE